MSFASLGLSAELLRAVEEEGYTEPTPVQSQAIPAVIAGRDVMAGAQTGTGKTAGFVLPLLQRIQPHLNTSTSPAKHPIRVLILTPTRELAMQVEESVKTYGKHVAVRSCVVYGGVNMDAQVKTLQGGVEVLVATPGRLLDHVQQRTVNLSRVEALVLDEADRMLDMGFIKDIRRIISLLPVERQNLMFSATFANEIKTLAESVLRDPIQITIARKDAAADTVRQVMYAVDRERKRDLLAHLIQSADLQQVLIFARTKHGASRLASQLERDGITTAAIHGDKSQPQRTQALEDFKAGKVRALVATDVAARGLDIDDLPHVINYELPPVAEDYVHRIGRTGRAGRSGDAISLVSADERELLAAIERMLKRKIEHVVLPGYEAGEGPREAAVAPRSLSGGAARGERRGEGRGEGRAAGRGEPRREGREPRPETGVGTRAEGRGRSVRAPRGNAPAADPMAGVVTRSAVPVGAEDPGGSAWESALTGSNQPGERATVPYGRKQRPVAALLGGLGRKAD